MEQSIRASFDKVKEELDEHLDSINENTTEINANFDHIAKLESKVDKLSERLDDISMMLSQILGKPNVSDYRKKFESIKLNAREQEIFLVLYTSDSHATYAEIARRLGLTFELVEKYIKSMMEKGVPIIKGFAGSEDCFSLDTEFKSIQAKENILGISEEISQIII